MGLFSDILLTVDYDRTLTAPDSTIPERNLEAIRYFIENGGAFTVNTGRSLPMTKVFAHKVPVNAPLLLNNGSSGYDLARKEMSFMHLIDLDMWQTIREVTDAFPELTVEIQGNDAHYIFSHNPLWEVFSANNDCAYATAQWGQDLGPFQKLTVYGKFRSSIMADFYTGTAEEMAQLDETEELLRQKYGEKVEVVRAAPRIIDVQAKGVSKARSARELQQKLGRKILVCVGDGKNDISMLTGADYAYAPADAIVADQFENVCDCAHGAVADVIYKKIPEILQNEP